MLLSVLGDSRNRQEWEYWLKRKDPHYPWEAFKLAQFYMFGKPVQINISAIPQVRVPAS